MDLIEQAVTTRRGGVAGEVVLGVSPPLPCLSRSRPTSAPDGAARPGSVVGGAPAPTAWTAGTAAPPPGPPGAPRPWSARPVGRRSFRPTDSYSSGQRYAKPPRRRKGDGDVSVDEILGQVLRNAVWERLDLLTELASQADAPSLLSVARSELPRLTEGWRALLAAHEPDDKGNCPECSGRWRQQKSPCSVWRAAYEHLVAGGLAPRPARHLRTAPVTPPVTRSRRGVAVRAH